LGVYDHGLSKAQVVKVAEISWESYELFCSLRKTTDLAQSTLLLFRNLPDRADLLQQTAQELCRARSTVEELLSIVEEAQGVIDDASSNPRP
jgi:hypothetical protein